MIGRRSIGSPPLRHSRRSNMWGRLSQFPGSLGGTVISNRRSARREFRQVPAAHDCGESESRPSGDAENPPPLKISAARGSHGLPTVAAAFSNGSNS